MISKLAALFLLTAALSLPAQQPMAEHAHAPAVPSTTLAFTVAGKSTTYNLADLKAMPQRTLTVHNGHNNKDEVYTGVALSDLLAKFGFNLDRDAKRIYRTWLKAEGTDRYWVLYSASEVWSAMHTGDTLVALTLDGQPIAEDGAFKLVSSDDKRPARWVRNLDAITVVTVE
jgi:hypothetical protein